MKKNKYLRDINFCRSQPKLDIIYDPCNEQFPSVAISFIKREGIKETKFNIHYEQSRSRVCEKQVRKYSLKGSDTTRKSMTIYRITFSPLRLSTLARETDGRLIKGLYRDYAKL